MGVVVEEYLGESKYDGNIRRVTLIKKVADILDMHNGDCLSYYRIGNEIVIRKVKNESKISPQINDFIPDGTPFEEAKMMIDASMEIAEYYISTKGEPSGPDMLEITEKAIAHFPAEFSNTKKAAMLKISIEMAKNIMSKTKVVDLCGENDDTE